MGFPVVVQTNIANSPFLNLLKWSYVTIVFIDVGFDKQKNQVQPRLETIVSWSPKGVKKGLLQSFPTEWNNN